MGVEQLHAANSSYAALYLAGHDEEEETSHVYGLLR